MSMLKKIGQKLLKLESGNEALTQSDQSSLGAQWVAKDPMVLHADSEDSDQTGGMPRLI